MFPEQFVLTKRGGGLLKNYYYEFMKENPELFIVADDGCNIVGFCMGYLCEKKGFKKNFVSRNFVALALRTFMLVVSGNRVFYSRIKKSTAPKNDIHSDETIVTDIYNTNQKGDLLSICVETSLRGTGVAAEMLSEYEKRLKLLDRKLCLLSVENKNVGAIRFYEKNGYRVYKKYGESYQYGKVL